MVLNLSFLKKLDFYTSPPYMYYDSKTRIESKMGGLLTLILLSLFIALSYLIFENTFNNSDFSLMVDYQPESQIQLTLDQLKLNFSIIDEVSGMPIPNDGTFLQVKFNLEKFTRNNYYLETVVDSSNPFNQNYQNSNGFYSPQSNTKKISLNSTNFLSLEVYICAEMTDLCKNSNTVTNYLKGKIFYFTYNNCYFTNEMSSKLISYKEENFDKLSHLNGRIYYIYIDSYIFNDDSNNLFSASKKDNKGLINSYRVRKWRHEESSKSQIKLDYNSPLIKFYFLYSGETITITNKNKNFLIAIAEISGAFNLIYFLFYILFSINGKLALESYIYNKFKPKKSNPKTAIRTNLQGENKKENSIESESESENPSKSENPSESENKSESESVRVSKLRPTILNNLQILKKLKGEDKNNNNKEVRENNNKSSNNNVNLIPFNSPNMKPSNIKTNYTNTNTNNNVNVQSNINSEFVRLNPKDSNGCVGLNILNKESATLNKLIPVNSEKQIKKNDGNDNNCLTPNKKLTSPILKYSVRKEEAKLKTLSKIGFDNLGKRSTKLEMHNAMRVENKHDKIVEQHGTVLDFLNRHIPKQAKDSTLPISKK